MLMDEHVSLAGPGNVHRAGAGQAADPNRQVIAAPSLAIRRLSKSFAGKTVLNSFTLDLARSEIHVLLGQNGSGKSTLIKVLSGYHVPDPGGEVFVGGKPLRFGSPQSAYLLGCRFVHQDLGLVQTSSVLDNLFFLSGYPTRGGTIQAKAAIRRARAALDLVGLDVDPRLDIDRLRPAEQTGVAIARAMLSQEGTEPFVLVLDEPTVTLPTDEVDRLLETLRTAAATGIAILYVTHHLQEVSELGQRVSVLRDGVLVDTQEIASLDRQKLVHQLIGSELEVVQRMDPPHQHAQSTKPSLTVTGVRAGVLGDLTLQAWPAEIAGLTGLDGSGREAVLPAIFGAIPRDAGQIEVDGVEIRSPGPRAAIKAGIGYLPANRRADGAVMEMSAIENMTLANLRPFWRRLRFRKRLERIEAMSWFNKLEIRPSAGINAWLDTFSGGNQQKVLFAKWLRQQPKVLLLDQPTQGVDIGAKAELHRQILEAARSGSAVLISSTDVEELATLCTRVLIVRNGRVVGELGGEAITETAINNSFHSQSDSISVEAEEL
jgi:ribose transport system ATP-binding protein